MSLANLAVLKPSFIYCKLLWLIVRLCIFWITPVQTSNHLNYVANSKKELVET